MKRRSQTHTSSLFLLELILAILFFSVSSAVCVQIFVHSHLLSKEAVDLNFAVNEVSSAAEQISSHYDDTKDSLVYYDADYRLCEKADAVYQLSIHYQSKDTLVIAEISMNALEDNHCIYILEVVRHQQRRVAHE